MQNAMVAWIPRAHLPHDRPDRGQSSDALLRVRPVKPHVTAVEEMRHWQLHADIVENDLTDEGGRVHVMLCVRRQLSSFPLLNGSRLRSIHPPNT